MGFQAVFVEKNKLQVRTMSA